MTSVLIHTSGLSDSEEEATKYSLRELTRSSTAALGGIFHFERKIKIKEVSRDKIDMIIAAMSVHGSESPEVMFFGTILIRDWLLSIEVVPDTTIDSLIASTVQTGINSINLFKSRGDYSSIIHAVFSLLFSLLGKHLSTDRDLALAPPLRVALAEVVSSDLVLALSPDACGIILACLPLLREATGDNCFLKRELIQFCLDFATSHDASDQSDSVDVDSLYCYSLSYLCACVERAIGDDQLWTIQKLYSKSKLVHCVSRSLVAHVNQRQFLLAALRFMSAILATGLWINRRDSEDRDSSSLGLFGLVSGPSTMVGIKSRVPLGFEEIDLDTLDDIFSAFSDENLSENDFQIPISICALAKCLCEFYGIKTTARGTAVQTIIKKWAVSALISSEPLIAASGLALVASMHVHGSQSVSYLMHADTFSSCMETLMVRNFEWARNESFSFVENLTQRENIDEKEIGKYMQLFIAKFKFHHRIMRIDAVKQLFFKSVSVKEAFGRLVDCIIADTVTFDQVVVVSRVLLQMIFAVKGKGSLPEFQAEVISLELNRGRSTRSLIAGLLRAIHIARAQPDDDTVEIIFHIYVNLIEKRNDKLDSFFLKAIPQGPLERKIPAILDPIGRSATLPDLDLPDSSSDRDDPRDVLSGFLLKCVPTFLIEHEEEKVDTDEPRIADTKGDADGNDWLNSAANWFLDTVGDSASDPEIPKGRGKHKPSKQTPEEDSDEEPPILKPGKSLIITSKPNEAEDEDDEAPVVAKAPPSKVVPKKAPVAAIPPVQSVKKIAVVKQVPKKGPPMVAKKATPLVVKKPPALPQPPPPVVEPPPQEEDETAEKQKKKKRKEEDVGILGGYLTDPTAALYSGFGGLWGSDPPKKEKKKKAKEDDESVAPPAKAVVAKPPPKMVPKTIPVSKKPPVPIKK